MRDTGKIQGTSMDRRRKLSEEEKKLIRRMRKEQGLTQLTLAEMFGVSKRLIQFVLNPAKLSHSKALFRKRAKDGRYRLNPEVNMARQKASADYKRELKRQGKI